MESTVSGSPRKPRVRKRKVVRESSGVSPGTKKGKEKESETQFPLKNYALRNSPLSSSSLAYSSPEVSSPEIPFPEISPSSESSSIGSSSDEPPSTDPFDTVLGRVLDALKKQK